MNYGEIKKTDIANGFGVRVSLFVSGCSHRCQDCFNSETWDFSYGQPFTAQTEEELLEALAPGFVNGLTLLGGDPFEISNQRALLPFLRRVKKAFPRQGYLVLHRRRPGSGSDPRRSLFLRSYRRNAFPHRRAGGRPLHSGAEGHHSAVPRFLQPAAHRYEGNETGRKNHPLGQTILRICKF